MINAARPIIVTDDPEDELIGRVVTRLLDHGAHPIILDTHELGCLAVSIGMMSAKEGDFFRVQDIEISNGSRVWWRRGTLPEAHEMTEMDPVVGKFMATQYRAAFRSGLLLARNWRGSWMNDPGQEWRLDENKLEQHWYARKAGLTVVPVLCSNDQELINAFSANYEWFAVKPVAGFVLRAEIDGQTKPIGLYTRRISRKELLSDPISLARCPILIQPYIEKAFELRVTIVGDRVFAARIDSQASDRTRVDWRNYDIANTPHSAVELPASTRTQLLRFMTLSGLKFAAIDMIVDPDGVIHFLEANPCGQYGWIEDLTHLPISDSIAQWLIEN